MKILLKNKDYTIFDDNGNIFVIGDTKAIEKLDLKMLYFKEREEVKLDYGWSAN